ncbi:MAG: SxtJ family membrane protein [Candidatus Brocadiaceae bacterium]|nr:SxtJ family membrane protein [Candidatus Brocadiaceae bacterium]
MGFFEGEEEVLAFTCNNYYLACWVANSILKWVGGGAFYLYVVLGDAMENKTTKIHGKEKELETIIVLALAGLVLFLIFTQKIFLLISLVLLCVSLLSKKLTSKISRLWLGFSYYIGTVNSKIILTLIFYFFLTPIALLFRLLKKNPLLLRRIKNINSYYIVRNYMPTQKDFEKIW